MGEGVHSSGVKQSVVSVCHRCLSYRSCDYCERIDFSLQVKVSSKTKHVVHFNVRAGDVIIWEFATKKRDIGFSECVWSVSRAVRGCGQ